MKILTTVEMINNIYPTEGLYLKSEENAINIETKNSASIQEKSSLRDYVIILSDVVSKINIKSASSMSNRIYLHI